MHKRPRSITVISWIFIAVGSASLIVGLLPLVDTAGAQHIARLKAQHPLEYWLMPVVRILAIISGVFMLYGFNWARWLLVVWLGYHVILSAMNSLFELLIHSLLLAVVLYFLFRPQASAYFRGTRAVPARLQ
ncbi:MAG: hypothetical protein JWQ71_1763 [Pedosphaera sp.]|nr:hypothetical protein [Pedosphaera sp.]